MTRHLVPTFITCVASARFALQQNRPNPFNPSTRITFEVAEPCNVKLEVFGPDGSRVATLVDRHYPMGSHVVQGNGTDTQGNRLPSGHYLCRILAGRFEATRKMVLLQ